MPTTMLPIQSKAVTLYDQARKRTGYPADIQSND